MSGRGFPLHVKFAHPDAGNPADRESALRHLTPGAVYGIRTMDVSGYSSRVTLHGTGAAEFPTVLFDPWWPQPLAVLDEKPGPS